MAQCWISLFKLIIVSFFFCLLVDEVISLPIAVAQVTVEVTKLAVSIYNYVEERDKGGGISNRQLLLEMKHVTEATKEDMIQSMWGLSRIEQIDGTVHAVNSLMKDIEKIVSATDLDRAKLYENDFVSHYQHNEITTKMRTLSRLLTYKSPGNDFTLLSHFTSTTRCNLTALAEFSKFYLNLMSEGISLHVMYDRLTKGLTPEQVIQDEWKGALQDIQSDLSFAEHGCVDKVWSLAKIDLYESTSAASLGKANTERYIYNWTDAMFYAAVGTYQFHYMKYIKEKLIFQKTDHQNKIAVIGNRGEKAENAKLIAQVKAKLKGAVFDIPSPENKQAAQLVGEAVEKHINGIDYSLEAIVVYFDGVDFKEQGTFTDKDSTVVTYEMPDVRLTYCYKNSLQCSSDRGKSTVGGRFKVYVYPSSKHTQPDSKEYLIGSATNLIPYKTIVVFVIFVISILNNIS